MTYPKPTIEYGTKVTDKHSGFTGAVQGAYIEPRGTSYDVMAADGTKRYIPQENLHQVEASSIEDAITPPALALQFP